MAFDFALLRFVCGLADDLGGDDPTKVYAPFILASVTLWYLQDRCQKEIASALANMSDARLTDAYGYVAHTYVVAGATAIEADRKALLGWMPEGLSMGPILPLPEAD